MAKDDDISVGVGTTDGAHVPHAKYEKLIARAKEGSPVNTIVAHPCDETSLRGVTEAAEAGIIVPILVGSVAKIASVAKTSRRSAWERRGCTRMRALEWPQSQQRDIHASDPCRQRRILESQVPGFRDRPDASAGASAQGAGRWGWGAASFARSKGRRIERRRPHIPCGRDP